MSKKFAVNFSKMDADTQRVLVEFYDSKIKKATLQVEHAETMKQLNAELDRILENRRIDLDAGMDADRVAEKFPRDDIDAKISKEQNAYKEATKELNKAINNDLAVLFPATNTYLGKKYSDAYVAYLDMVNNGKRGGFIDFCNKFCLKLGISATQSQINDFVNRMTCKIGAKSASASVIVSTGNLTVEQSSRQFLTLFLSAFCDVYLAKCGTFINMINKTDSIAA